MDNNLIPADLDQRLREGCKEAIRNINKNLNRWCETKKYRSRIEVSLPDLNGLVKNWMMRCLKDKIGHGPTEQVFKRGVFFTHLSPEGNISSITTNSLDHWAKNMYHTRIGEILSTLNYNDLRYNEQDYNFLEPIATNFEPTFFVDFSGIRNFSFNK